MSPEVTCSGIYHRVVRWKSTNVSYEYSTFIFRLAYYSTLNMNEIYSSATSAEFHQTTWHYMPEDRYLHNHRSENINPYKYIKFRILDLLQVSIVPKYNCMGQNSSWELDSWRDLYIFFAVTLRIRHRRLNPTHSSYCPSSFLSVSVSPLNKGEKNYLMNGG
jgi:hypothetical protein